MSGLKVMSRVESKPSESFGFNSKFFVNGDSDSLTLEEVESSKRRGRPPKVKRLDSGTEYIAVENNYKEPSPLDGTISYKKTYEPTTNMLLNSVGQIDNLSSLIQSDLNAVRASKTLKNKYSYISELTGATTSLVGSKISAIRELNSIISKCHDLDMKRVKELKLNEENNDDKNIMDMYNAFINTPVGTVQGMPFGGITPMQINSPTNTMGIVGVDVDNNIRPISGNPGYDNYIKNITPEQNAMTMENNPYIRAVVVYNQENQDKWFDVIDTSTGQSVPNVPRPADFLLRDMRVDVRTGVARNSSANMEFDVMLIGNRAMDEY